MQYCVLELWESPNSNLGSGRWFGEEVFQAEEKVTPGLVQACTPEWFSLAYTLSIKVWLISLGNVNVPNDMFWYFEK